MNAEALLRDPAFLGIPDDGNQRVIVTNFEGQLVAEIQRFSEDTDEWYTVGEMTKRDSAFAFYAQA